MGVVMYDKRVKCSCVFKISCIILLFHIICVQVVVYYIFYHVTSGVANSGTYTCRQVAYTLES